MREGRASVTAQRVAALRLTFAREPAPYADPAPDEALARDVAQSPAGAPSPMTDYLRARTVFFDRVVVRAIDRGIRQVVVAAAGYDGRALRYAKPGVRWFEVDHPDTQADKLERIHRLRIDASHVTFVAADFADTDVGDALRAQDHDATVATLMLCEGVAVYLERAVLESLLGGLRSVAAPGSRLAISMSVSSDAPGLAARRATFARRVAAVGEPARTVLTVDDADLLFAATGWRQLVPTPPAGSDRARHAGFVLAEPS